MTDTTWVLEILKRELEVEQSQGFVTRDNYIGKTELYPSLPFHHKTKLLAIVLSGPLRNSAFSLGLSLMTTLFYPPVTLGHVQGVTNEGKAV